MWRTSCSFFIFSALWLSGFACLLQGYGGDDALWQAAAGGIWSVGLLWWALRRPSPCTLENWRPGLGAVCLLALYLLAILTLPWSANRFTAANGVALATLMLCGSGIIRSQPRALLCPMLVSANLAVTAFVVIGFLQLAGCAESRHWFNGQFAGPFVNSAHWGALVAAVIPVAMGLALSPLPPIARLLSLVTGLLGVISLSLTPSRSVWLLVTILYPSALVMLWRRRRHSDPQGTRVLAIGTGLFLLTVAAVLVLFHGRIVERFKDFRQAHGQSLSQRVEVWALAGRMIRHHPAGVGLGGFDEEDLLFKTSPDRFDPERAHNELLQVTAELGWLAMLPLTIGLLILARDAFAFLRSPPTSSDSLHLGLWTAVLVYGLHSMVDFPLRLTANAWYGLVVMASLRPEPILDRPTMAVPEVRHPWLIRFGLATLAILTLAWWGACGLSRHMENRGLASLRHGRFMAARVQFAAASGWMPWDPDLLLRRATLSRTESGGEPMGKTTTPSDPDPLNLLNQAARLAPHRASIHVQRGHFLARRNRKAAAEAAFRTAIACDPTLGAYSAYYGNFLAGEKRLPEAAAEYRRALDKFHDSGDVDLKLFLARLDFCGADATILAAATPPDAPSQRVLRDFLERKHAPHP